ncbi:acyltransferase family protein [Oculatella sp. LEGE 06141]|uniref:acyltransferase family protein n=1 Tax=Oculatella sp. LEGE 06141 TaxID=1828648 RepID=UPI0030D8E7D5
MLRLICAFAVFVFHINTLTGEFESINRAIVLLSGSAVHIFFIMSGFLIFMSFERSKSLKEYTIKRVRRIYPAYCLIILLAAIGGVFISTLAWSQYFTDPALFRYLGFNLSFLNFGQLTLPGVFTENLKPIVNGSLWTIRSEVVYYALTPVFVYLYRRTNKLLVFSGVYLFSVVYTEGLRLVSHLTGDLLFYKLAIQFPGQLSYFICGAFLYYYIEFFRKHTNKFLLVAVPLYVVSFFLQIRPLQPICLAIIVFYIVFQLPYISGSISKFGDLSYGIYIFHYPLIQLLYPYFKANPYLAFGYATVLLLVTSYSCWHLIEKPFLSQKSHYRLRSG